MTKPFKNQRSRLKTFLSRASFALKGQKTVFKTNNNLSYRVPRSNDIEWPSYGDEAAMDPRANVKPSMNDLERREEEQARDHQRIEETGICNGIVNSWLSNIANDGMSIKDSRPDEFRSLLAQTSYIVRFLRPGKPTIPNSASELVRAKFDLEELAADSRIFGLNPVLNDAHNGTLSAVLDRVSKKEGIYKIRLIGSYDSGPNEGQLWGHETALVNEKNAIHFLDPEIGLKRFRSLASVGKAINKLHNSGGCVLSTVSAIRIERNLSREEKGKAATASDQEANLSYGRDENDGTLRQLRTDVVSYPELPDFRSNKYEVRRFKADESVTKLYEKELSKSEDQNSNVPIRKAGFKKSRFTPITLRDSGFKQNTGDNAGEIKRLDDRSENAARENSNTPQLDPRDRSKSRGR